MGGVCKRRYCSGRLSEITQKKKKIRYKIEACVMRGLDFGWGVIKCLWAFI
jgi:hypothetical protein